ncbi:MAG: carboxypeptidase regulatory-like domain-containing protein [Gemmatimonadota bacterium]
MTRPLRILIPILALASFVDPVGAQERVRIEGRVVEQETGEAIPSVDVVVRAPNDRFLASAHSNDEGRFTIDVRRADAVWLYAARIGYADNRTPLLRFEDHTFFEVEIRLDRDAVLLAPLEVVARRSERRSPVLVDFDRRVRSGMGIYITRHDIERRKPTFVTDMLATVPGVEIVPVGSGTRRKIQMTRTAGRNCPVQIFVDGLLVTKRLIPWESNTGGFTVDDLASPNSVEGIEIYRGLSSVPAQFLTPEADCGVVAIWTRRGG